MMKKTVFAFLLLAALTLAGPPPARAQTMTPEAAQDVAAAENYLQSLTTAEARFTQTANDGRQVSGTFYLDRPGRLRFEYDAPFQDLVVADGIFIYFYDSETKQQSSAPIAETLANFLLRKHLKLSGDITVTAVDHSTGGLLLITLIQTGHASDGSLTLAFEQNPLRLKKWRVVDSTKAITEIELSGLQTGMKLPAKLFVFKNPGRHGLNQ
jgi:outer membrane lipoprotein-sorting protein